MGKGHERLCLRQRVVMVDEMLGASGRGGACTLGRRAHFTYSQLGSQLDQPTTANCPAYHPSSIAPLPTPRPLCGVWLVPLPAGLIVQDQLGDRDFPGSPVVETLPFHCTGLIPSRGTKVLPTVGPKKKMGHTAQLVS